MGVTGNRLGQLRWRLQNGESPLYSPRLVILYIGMNDLSFSLGLKQQKCGHRYGRNQCKVADAELGKREAADIVRGIKLVIDDLQTRCWAPILISALFPRDFRWPKGPFSTVVPLVNKLLREDKIIKARDEISVIDCSSVVLTARGQIDRELMPDYVRLSPLGYMRWAECLAPTLNKLLSKQMP